MAGETTVHIRGNLTADPEIRWTQNGIAVASFTIASTPRIFDRQKNEWVDQEALFLRCSAWRDLAEHVAASLTKGSAVIAEGFLKQRSYTDRDNNPRTSIELDVQDIGPSLRLATAQVTRTGGNRNQDQRTEQLRNQQNGGMRPGTSPDQPWSPNQGHPQDGQIGNQQSSDVWSTPGGYEDTEPF